MVPQSGVAINQLNGKERHCPFFFLTLFQSLLRNLNTSLFQNTSTTSKPQPQSRVTTNVWVTVTFMGKVFADANCLKGLPISLQG